MMLVVTPNSRPLNTHRGQAVVCAALDLPSFPGFPGRQEKVWNFAVLLNKSGPSPSGRSKKSWNFAILSTNTGASGQGYGAAQIAVSRRSRFPCG